MPRTSKAKPSAKKRKGKADPQKAVDDAPIPTKKAKDEPDDPTTSTGEIKKVTFSGTVPVDENCTLSGYHVYIDKDVDGPFGVSNATLNQTNIGANNNKYYILQVLEHNSKFLYATWFRWGRVGKVAGTNLEMHGGNLNEALYTFQKKFREKTGNTWINLYGSCAVPFQKVKGKYDLLEMDYGEKDEKPAKMDPKPVQDEVPSKLDTRIQEVVDLICNIREFEACVKEMEFDVKKAPLGKLTTNQIKRGYETLKKIEKCIHDGKFGSDLADACSEFYTRVPHDFGMRTPPLIRTPQQLKKKIELLEALADIQIAIQMMDKDDEDREEMNVKDRHYQDLGCKLEPFDTKSEEFKMVEKYVGNSHGSTHRQYELKVENVYEVTRKGDKERFKENIGNRMLLWHGSRLTNWCGILQQGLRIAPPEAPVTGYMFGKGVYFADMVSKSANYCYANQRQPHGFLLLCEVALGKTNDKTGGDYDAAKLPKGKSSTKGLGREFPDPKGNKKLKCGMVCPLGKPITAKDGTKFGLMYNEFIVYDVAQIKAKYLVKVKFDYKSYW